MEDNRTTTKSTLEISLALSGGVARGTFHLGFIQALQENSIQIKAISGTSAGALIGGAVACGIKPKEVLNILKSKEFKTIFKFNWFRKSLFRINHNNPIINKLFSFDDLRDTKIPFFACVADINTQETIYANEGDAKKLIIASCSLIPVFEPLVFNERVLADGGVTDLMPTTPLLDFNYPILGINLMPISKPYKLTFFSLITQSFKFLIRPRVSQNIKDCKWFISPKELLKIKKFSFDNLENGFNLGYKNGIKWCEENIGT